MPFFKTLTQGGQVHIHQLHMLKQVLVAGTIVAFVVGISCFAWKSYQLPEYGWRVLSQTSWARFVLITNPTAKHSELYQDYMPLRGKPYRRSCLNIIKDPFLKKTTQQMETALIEIAYKSLRWAGWSFLAPDEPLVFSRERSSPTSASTGEYFYAIPEACSSLEKKG